MTKRLRHIKRTIPYPCIYSISNSRPGSCWAFVIANGMDKGWHEFWAQGLWWPKNIVELARNKVGGPEIKR